MAANNYFGFTHGGTQYTSPAATYQTGQGGYAVGAHPPNYSAPARPAQTAYEGYQTTTGHGGGAGNATAAYNFTTGAAAARAQDPPPPPPPPPATTQTYDAGYTFRAGATAGAYDGSKTYYQQQQAAKTTYTAGGTFNNANRGGGAQKSGGNNSNYGYAAAAVSTTYPTNYNSANSASPATTTANFSGTGYDAALYSAATMYVQQQQANTVNAQQQQNKQPNNWNSFKKPGMKMNKPKQPPKPQQLHYCDVCKISCAGPQTYREHLEGQKHKKKEAAAKTGGVVVTQSVRPGNSLRCELCDVTCTGADAYAAHIRGAKHQKVVKLHTKLGKPIPSMEPTVIGATPTPTVTNKTSVLAAAAVAAKQASAAMTLAPGTAAVAAPVVIKTLVTPKITFVGGTKLSTTAPTNPASELATTEEQKPDELMADDSTLDMSKYDDKADIVPVGQDYIEEIKNEEGKVISFQCKLCDCRFNDPNAKEMHMKGRRHRLQYKKKVNPELIVDVKPSLRQRKMQEDKMRRHHMKEDVWRRREEDRWRDEMRQVAVPSGDVLFSNPVKRDWMDAFDDEVSPLRRMMEEEERLYWEERRRYEEEMEYFEWYRRYGRDPRGIPPPMSRPFPGQAIAGMPPMPVRRPDTLEDRHVVAKHAEIYPKEDELQSVQKIVSNTEKALKQVSDFLAESQTPAVTSTEAKVVPKQEPIEVDESKETEQQPPPQPEEEEVEKKDEGPARILKGVMRVGVLAKGLLLKGDSDVQLVVLCSEKPTAALLETVATNLPIQLTKITEDTYNITIVNEAASIVVSTSVEPKINVHVTLTSPVVREPAPGEAGENVTITDPPDVLDRQKCLDALAALRHAKWFQARASGLQSCVIIIRILRDLCQRVPTWTPLNSWAMELLVEKVLCSSGIPMSPGDALRRVFEALASGVLLSGGPGLMDPCEKDPTDAAVSLTDQEREDITASAQHALRLLAFRQIHKVLGMDPLPAPKFTKGRFTRKRRRDNSTSEGPESEGADGKKDKKDDGDVVMEPVVVNAGE